MTTIKFKPDGREAYDKTPVQLKVRPGVRERLKTIDNWQERVRVFLDKLIEEDGG